MQHFPPAQTAIKATRHPDSQTKKELSFKACSGAFHHLFPRSHQDLLSHILVCRKNMLVAPLFSFVLKKLSCLYQRLQLEKLGTVVVLSHVLQHFWKLNASIFLEIGQEMSRCMNFDSHGVDMGLKCYKTPFHVAHKVQKAHFLPI